MQACVEQLACRSCDGGIIALAASDLSYSGGPSHRFWQYQTRARAALCRACPRVAVSAGPAGRPVRVSSSDLTTAGTRLRQIDRSIHVGFNLVSACVRVRTCVATGKLEMTSFTLHSSTYARTCSEFSVFFLASQQQHAGQSPGCPAGE